MKFEDLELSTNVLQAIRRLGFTTPTMIQERAIPLILQGKDVVGESATGSGKTLAFGCGVIDNITPRKGLQALILTPTRELAEQVKESLLQYCQNSLSITAVYGGVGFNPQVQAIERADVVVGTPGRLLDHLQQRTISLNKISLLVLDEADRMLDMGFIEDVEKIMSQCSKQRQTLFFSATISHEIKELAEHYMKHPEFVFASKEVDPSKLTQVYYDIEGKMKLSLLVHLLQKEQRDLIMIFCNTRQMTDILARNLRVNKIRATAIHGGLTQNRRNQVIEQFTEGKFSVLVCTDVAARGLHIDNVSHVYNYDLPKDPKEYVHRIGRTARAGEAGKVINLLSDRDHDSFGKILREYKFDIQCQERPYVERAQIDREQSGHRNHFQGNNRPNHSQQRNGTQRNGQRQGNRQNSPRDNSPRSHAGPQRHGQPHRHHSQRQQQG